MTKKPKQNTEDFEKWVAVEQERLRNRQAIWPEINASGKMPTPEELVKAMLRDFRFKRIMLVNTERLFDTIPPEIRLQLFREAAKEVLASYKLKDLKDLSLMLGRELRKEAG